MKEKNPNKEIFFYKHWNSKLVYILMSHQISKLEFDDLFPETTEITQAELDELVELNDYKVVMVGDDKIIDEHFTDN